MSTLPTLPPTATEADWDRLFADDAALQPGVASILQRLGLQPLPRRRFDDGSLPVYAVGDALVLKLYAPHEAAHAEVEARVLAGIDGRLPLPTPSPLATGTHADWRYLLMSRLRGQPLAEAWPELTAPERERLAAELGEALAALHAVEVDALADLPPPHWPDFVPAQRASAVQRQRDRGLAEPWLAQIEPFLQRWHAPPGAQRVLLHTEVMREHLLVERHHGQWRLSGLFDFEPAMLGEPLYEFASVGLFVTCGDAPLLRGLLQAYGRVPIDDDLPCRLMALALLHRYSHLPWYLRRLPVPGATTLEQLAGHWWGLDPDRPPAAAP